ncbi:MAG: hypothetical protein GDA43_14585 [Hormoscilla sp. SP5CHS1]|nr:hypothetical protein [Hormoscilla sp. SP5CHS1]
MTTAYQPVASCGESRKSGFDFSEVCRTEVLTTNLSKGGLRGDWKLDPDRDRDGQKSAFVPVDVHQTGLTIWYN